MYPEKNKTKKTSTTLNPCSHNHCFWHARYSQEVARGGMRHNHPFCIDTVVTERVKGLRKVCPNAIIKRK